MKKLFCLCLLVAVTLSVGGCGTNVNTNTAPSNSQSDVAIQNEEKSQQKKENELRIVGVEELEALISEQPIKVISTKYTVQDEKYKALYPDMLQAILKNDTEYDIKNAVVAYVAWDKNNLPVKIEGSMDFSDGSYIRQVNFSDINLVPGAEYGHESGYEISDDIQISTFKAIAVSYEAFSGETWENPYYDEWCKMYEGVKYTDDLSIKMK